MDQLLVENDLASRGARRLSTERRVRANGDQQLCHDPSCNEEEPLHET